MKKHKTIIFISILCILISILLIIYYNVKASIKKDGIENFPSSYKPYLQELAKKHKNWKFRALYTDFNWDYVIKQENIYGKNLVPKNYSDNWKNTKKGEYNVEIDKGWVDSSKKAVEYCMDPRNFLNEGYIFQFETLSYESSTNNLNGIEKILYGTEFYNKRVSYLDSNGKTINMSEKYSDLILKGGKTSKVSPYHLASRIKQEVGPFLSHNSISGKVEGYKGYYNFYNIGATSSPTALGAIKKGLQYAKDGNGASQTTKNKYLIPWNTKEKSITGGAIFIGSSYINVGQNTIYLQKFDVNDDRKGTLFTHQYMTNILAPSSEAKSIYNGYQKSGLLDTSMTFIIPVYNNMPNIPTHSPNINDNDFSTDNTKVYCNSEKVTIRTGPSTSYESITTVNKSDKMTRILKGKQSGERWDKVRLENGIIGFIYQNYVSKMPSINIKFDSPLRVNNLEVSGIDYNKNTVKDVKNKITTNYEIEIVNYQNKVLSDKDIVGTGSKIRVKEKGSILTEYSIIIYGDANGDGKINSVDLLVIQRHILKIKSLSTIFKKASNINKNGKNPTSVDLLLIQRHILNLKKINQGGT